MAEESTKKSVTNDSLYKSLTHTRPKPTTQAPTLKRPQSNNAPPSSDTSKGTTKKP
jgi:hypothetical protein